MPLLNLVKQSSIQASRHNLVFKESSSVKEIQGDILRGHKMASIYTRDFQSVPCWPTAALPPKADPLNGSSAAKLWEPPV